MFYKPTIKDRFGFKTIEKTLNHTITKQYRYSEVSHLKHYKKECLQAFKLRLIDSFTIQDKNGNIIFQLSRN